MYRQRRDWNLWAMNSMMFETSSCQCFLILNMPKYLKRQIRRKHLKENHFVASVYVIFWMVSIRWLLSKGNKFSGASYVKRTRAETVVRKPLNDIQRKIKCGDRQRLGGTAPLTITLKIEWRFKICSTECTFIARHSQELSHRSLRSSNSYKKSYIV